MAEPFKNMFNEQFFDLFTKDLKLVIDDFDACEFVSQVMDDEWEGRELKQLLPSSNRHWTTAYVRFLAGTWVSSTA
jgi:hypothetical protein